MSVKLIRINQHVINMKTRLPFKYGIATLTAVPHLILSIEIEVNGKKGIGVAADGLAPKWFTKNPDSSFKDDIEEMLLVIKRASRIGKDVDEAETIFDFWHSVYQAQYKWGNEEKLPALLTSFGVSLFERALISAYCNAESISFHQALVSGKLGYNFDVFGRDIPLKNFADLLPIEPLNEIEVRHTVGLGDPLLDKDIVDKINDGFPQSLEQNLKTYGLKKLKIKVKGDLESDVPRLFKIYSLTQKLNCPPQFTLDGNEQFTSAESFKIYWENLMEEKALESFFENLLFVEQPIHRDYALTDDTAWTFLNWNDRPKIIIDESDGELNSAVKALKCGYSGTSHKNCKGIFKSVTNAVYLKHKNGIQSAEDLCNVGPIALQQDLAVAAALGISHVERNGHHYMPGLSMFPEDIQQNVMKHHADLYSFSHGYPSLNIEAGKINLSSVNSSPFGVGFDLNPERFTPLKEWDFSSLDLS